jgi:acyl-CoA synthetase (NDP forming)
MTTVSRHYDSYVVIRDGSTLHLRPVQPGDEARLRELHERLSRKSLYFRFLSIPRDGSRDDGALRGASGALMTRLGPAMTAATVQQMVRGGVELLVGATFDPTFGPLIACGSGGVLVDLVHDITFRILPLTDIDAAEMLVSLKGAALLRGYRGRPPVDQPAAIEALLRVSALLEICPEIHELDINPLKVLERGVRAVDVRVQVSDQAPVATSRRVSY